MRRILIAFLFLPLLSGQTKKPPAPADYGQWESLINPGRNGGLSPDGKWLAYGINRANGNNDLRIVNVGDGTSKTAAFGAQTAFSSDSRWAAYSIGYSEAQADKMRNDKKPVHNKLGLLNLASGEQTVVDGIQSFAFSPTGTWLAMRRYPPEKPGGGGGAPPAGGDAAPAEEENPVSAILIVRNLTSGRDTTFGNVSEYAWQDLQKRGHLLAMAISVEDKTGNGVQLFDSATGSLRVLDSSASAYTTLAWRKDSADLAVLRAKTDDKREGPTYAAIAWRHLGEASEDSHTYDPSKDAKFPTGMRTVSYRRPTWSQDGETVFIGMSTWYEKPPAAKKDTAKDKDADDEPASVVVWHWRDSEVMARQQKGANQDRQRNMLAAWNVGSGKFVQLAKSPLENVTPLKKQKMAYAADWKSYAMERSIGRPAADLYLVDLASGDRTKIRERLPEDHYVQASPGGRYLLYFENDNYWTVDTSTRAVVNITKNVKSAFADKESDFTIKQKPAFGVAGWTKDDSGVIVYDKFDLWPISPDGLVAGRAAKLKERPYFHGQLVQSARRDTI